MSEPYLGEIRIFASNFAPRNWAVCDGQELAISQNQALFSLIGTRYGGNGTSNFALPDLRGRVPIHFDSGQGLTMGGQGGSINVTLTLPELGAHTHPFYVSTKAATQFVNFGNYGLGTAVPGDGFNDVYPYIAGTSPNTVMASATSSLFGGGGSHNNMQPTAITTYCIAIQGTYPPKDD